VKNKGEKEGQLKKEKMAWGKDNKNLNKKVKKRIKRKKNIT
jgi:hypothetical protein